MANPWVDPYQYDSYLNGCAFQPHSDNLVNYSEQRRQNFMSVDRIVSFGSHLDGVIIPW